MAHTHTTRAVIREARVEDASQLAMLSAQLGYPVAAAKLIHNLRMIFADPSHVIFVAEVPDQGVIGWVHAYIRPTLMDLINIELGGLVVEEGWRGQGIGTRLMNQLEDWARGHGVESVYIRSNVKRVDTHPFYQSLGYETIKTSLTFYKVLSYD